MTAQVAGIQGTVSLTLAGVTTEVAAFEVPIVASLGDRQGHDVSAALRLELRRPLAEALRQLADRLDPYLERGGAA